MNLKKVAVFSTTLFVLFSLQGTSRADFRFDWRGFYSANAARFLPEPRPPAGPAPSLSARDCLVILTYNGFGAAVLRRVLLDHVARVPSLPSPSAWTDYALLKRYIRPLPVVGADSRVSGALALELAAHLAGGDPSALLPEDGYDRLGEAGLLPAWLWVRFARAVPDSPPSPEMLAGITAFASPADRVFLYALAASDPARYSPFAAARLAASKDEFERACALLVLARLPADDRPPSFSPSLLRLLARPEERPARLAAMAALLARDPSFLPALRPAAPSSAAFAAAYGACLPDPALPSLAGDRDLPPLMRGYALLGAASPGRKALLPVLRAALRSESAEERALAALAVGVVGGPSAALSLRSLFQDASYEVRACSVLGAGFLEHRQAFTIFRAFVQDKHHQELSAMASVLLARDRNRAVPRLLDGIDEYTFARERGFALFALGSASPDLFARRAPRWRSSDSPFLRRFLALGGLMSGDSSWLKEFERSIVQYQDYLPWGKVEVLRARALERLLPDPFDFLFR